MRVSDCNARADGRPVASPAPFRELKSFYPGTAVTARIS